MFDSERKHLFPTAECRELMKRGDDRIEAIIAEFKVLSEEYNKLLEGLEDDLK